MIQSSFSTVICAPIYTARHGLSSEVDISPESGRKHDCAIACDGLVSLPKSALSDYVGSLDADRLDALGAALRIALDLDDGSN